MGQKSSVPVIRAWQNRDRAANLRLAALISLPILLWLLAFTALTNTSACGLTFWAGVAAAIPGFIAFRTVFWVPEICPNCDVQVNPNCQLSELVGQEFGYGVETRHALTYNRPQPNGAGQGYYQAIPVQETTYQASYPVLHKSWLNHLQCPSCGFQSVRPSTTTHRIG